MKVLLYFLFFVFILTISHNANGQMVKKQYGSTAYIRIFCNYAKQIGIDDLRFSKDSLRIRIWKPGKLIDLSIKKDTLFGQKIFYVHTNPSRKQKPNQWQIICNKFKIENEQIKIIKPMIDTICMHYPKMKEVSIDPFFWNNSGKIKNDSASINKMESRDGGIHDVIEYANKDEYVWSGWISCSQQGEIIERILDVLEMEKYNEMDIADLPKGSWYSYGGCGNVYKLTFFEGLIYRITFWKRL